MTVRASARAALLAVVALIVATQARPTAAPARGVPLLWEGTREAHRVVLFGTIHIPDPRVVAMPVAVTAALAKADRVVTEIPLDPAAQAAMAGLLLLPGDQRLRAIIGEARFARLEAAVRRAVGDRAPLVSPLLVSMLDRLKPWAAMAQLASLEYLPEVLGGALALDVRIYADAAAAGKRVGGLETAAEQAGTFDAFTTEEQTALLQSALEELETPGTAPTSAMLVEWYLAGDGDKLAAALLQAPGDAALARKFQAEVLVARNHRMADRIDRLRLAFPTETLFVAVGALHLVGPDNLPQLLRARGYDITRARP